MKIVQEISSSKLELASNSQYCLFKIFTKMPKEHEKR